MEKIININMAGRVIAIEDSAYTALKAYLESLSQYFAKDEGGEEILNDIESRVAELMSERIRRGSNAITPDDITAIKASMGSVEDFAAADDEEMPNRASVPPVSEQTQRQQKRVFRRDASDKIAGGVCSGMAAYLQIDPTLVRIVFAILALGGWGFGIVLYLALWIFVPSANVEGFKGRRLFRNADDKWLGGVASGIAAYFEKEAWIFRLIFAAPFLLSLFSNSLDLFIGTTFVFGSLTGSFCLIYIVLWMVLPLARSDYDRMEMRGEKVDLDSIRKNVMSDIKDRTDSFSAEVKDSAGRLKKEAQGFMSGRGREFAQEAKEAGSRLATRGGSVLGSLFSAISIFIGVTVALILFFLLIGFSFSGLSGLLDDFVFQTDTQRSLAWASIYLLIGIPLLAIITSIVRRRFKIRSGARAFSAVFTLLWVVGLICAVALGSSLVKDFNVTSRTVASVPIAQPLGKRLLVTVPGASLSEMHTFTWFQDDVKGWAIRDGALQSSLVNVVPELSPDSMYHVFVRRSAMGRSSEEAQQRAGHIAYNVRSNTDSILVLDNGYAINKEDRFRAQQVVVTVQVPVGKQIYFDQSIVDKLTEFHLPVRHYKRKNGKSWRVGWTYEAESNPIYWEPGIDYTMNANGQLVGPDGVPAATSSDDFEIVGRRSSVKFKSRLDSIERLKFELEQRADELEQAIDQ